MRSRFGARQETGPLRPRAAMGVGAVGELFAVLPVLFSPVRSMRELSAAPTGSAVAVTEVTATAQNQPVG